MEVTVLLEAGQGPAGPVNVDRRTAVASAGSFGPGSAARVPGVT
ncbi:hypothetical protein GJR88_04603 [Dietzia sp. DQ12-45-1b]|nr:hypothetical protein GJR88_04603 [Dietzia sp. DQ12-45-1b]